MSWGGKRINAGRPAGRGKYGESTIAIRVPLSRVEDIKRYIGHEKGIKLPFYASKVKAGFPSPADDYIESYLDLNSHLIQHPAATFLLEASGDSMINAGISSGDMLIVDKGIEPTHGSIVIAAIDGELTVKRLSRSNGQIQLLPENPKYKSIDITDEQDLVIWGVVTYVIHKAR